MKILFFANMYPDEYDQVQGLFIKNQLENLVISGLEVDILHIRIEKPYIDYIKGYFALRKKIKYNNYNLIHAHYGFMGFLASFQKLVPFVLTLHGSDVNIGWQKLFSKFAVIFAKSVIVTNKEHKKIIGNKAVLIPTGIDTKVFYPIDKTFAREQLGLKKNSKYVVFPSWRTRKVKNYELFQTVLLKLKEKDPTFEEIFLEGLTSKEVNLVFNAADVLLLTSYSEGSPLVIREALASNLPIVSVNVGDVAERIKNFSNCFIVNYNPNEIYFKIIEITNNNLKAQNIGKSSLYSLEENAIEILNVYKKVITNKEYW